MSRMAIKSDYTSIRQLVLDTVHEQRNELINITRDLLSYKTESPRGDTEKLVYHLEAFLQGIDGVKTAVHSKEKPIFNLSATVKSPKMGRRLIFNGHLDTFPVGSLENWTCNPLTGEIKGGRMYGRGISDMKGGIACSIIAFKVLSMFRESWRGELVLTLASDEETMGTLGTKYMLDTVPEAIGDGMISGDAGSPMVIRFGEKGMVWIDIHASGKASHGAHVHLGQNAIERLIAAMQRLTSLRDLKPDIPAKVVEAIQKSSVLSESLSGQGESETLQSVTVNFGKIQGGLSANLVPDNAEVNVDIRLPVGITTQTVKSRIDAILSSLPGISYEIVRSYEPSWTDPDHEIVQLTARNCQKVLGKPPAINLRVGASDARLYRLYGVPAVVCGLTPNNLGGPDEYIVVKELYSLAAIHTLTALDYLSENIFSAA